MQHYDRHLAAVYAWMVGGAPAAIERAGAELKALGLGPPQVVSGQPPPRAVDLGAGFGAHAIPLARWGYDVVAVDSSGAMLEQLQELAGDLPISLRHGDLVEVATELRSKIDILLCMTDTLCHLESLGDVDKVIDAARRCVRPGGLFVVSMRDYRKAPVGERVFLCVCGDDRRIATCGLEFEEQRVLVDDLLHERTSKGWSVRASRYSKLRIDPKALAREFGDDWELVFAEAPSGLATLAARRR